MSAKGKGKGAPPGPPPGKAPPIGKPGIVPSLSKAAQPAPYTGPKLRPLFWTTVADVPPDSIWTSLEAPVAYDEAALERQFEAAASRPAAKRVEEGGSERKRLRTLRVLDDRTSQRLAIALSRLPMPGDLAQMVDKFDGFPWSMSADAVQTLAAALGENKEAIDQMQQLLRSDGEDPAMLDMPEKYLWELDRVPHVVKKLDIGILLVNSTELPEWRSKLAKVGIACQMLRKSKHLSRCISTALAIGNHLNRGTSRAGARGLVLPDSLLKLEELRGGSKNGGAEEPGKEQAGQNLLEFVAGALVEAEARNNEPEGQVSNAVNTMLENVRAAAGVALEEIASAVPQKIAEATRAAKAVAELEPTPGQQRAAAKVNQICDEANLALKLADGAHKEFERLRRWSCTKATAATKTESWFSLWVQFLEQLSRAIAKAQKERRERLQKRPALSELSQNVVQDHAGAIK